MNANEMTMDYVWADSVTERDAHTNWSNADALDVRYHAFGGNLSFRVQGVDFAPKGKVAVLDFALCLAHVTEELQDHADGESSSLDFSEGEEELLIWKDKKHVTITSLKSKQKAQVKLNDFRTAAKSFAKRVVLDACKVAPTLRNHPAYHAWMTDVGA